MAMRKTLALVWGLCAFFALPAGVGQAVATPAGIDHQVAVAAIPAKAYATLQKIDAGTWPQSGAPGTRGGTVWQNREGRLPAEDDQGCRLTYREWDVNDKIQGRNRDAERIITGSDHSAWYTGDHYRTFERMR
jgi:ribonuclease T1